MITIKIEIKESVFSKNKVFCMAQYGEIYPDSGQMKKGGEK